MIVVIEGIDRVGKTTLAKKLEEKGFVYLKDEFVIPQLYTDAQRFKDYSIGKCDSFVAIAKLLQSKGKSVVIDRLHLTEIVYGVCERGGNVHDEAIWAIDKALDELGAYLCYVVPSDIELSNELHGEEQSKKAKLFDSFVKLTSMKLMTCDFKSIDIIADYFNAVRVEKANGYDIYFASPFFNPEQIEREERLIKHLRKIGFSVFSPRENCLLKPMASIEDRKKVFDDNCNAIKNSRAVFAVTDGKDVGTIWEAGYAYGIEKPVMYYAETLGDNLFNLMLAQSGKKVFLKQEEVTYDTVIDAICGYEDDYEGAIE